jgi:uncharacterized protein (TIGR02246 family)
LQRIFFGNITQNVTVSSIQNVMLEKTSLGKIWMTKLFRWIVLGLIIFGVLTSVYVFVNQSMKQEHVQSLIEKAREAWIAQDADALTKLFTPDGEVIIPGQFWLGERRIREEVIHFAQQYKDVKIDIKRIIIERNQAAVEWNYEDTEKNTGRRNQSDDVIVVDFKDGRISRWREYFDTKTPASR